VPISCVEWDGLNQQGPGAKALYLQNKLDRMIEVAAAIKPAGARAGTEVSSLSSANANLEPEDASQSNEISSVKPPEIARSFFTQTYVSTEGTPGLLRPFREGTGARRPRRPVTESSEEDGFDGFWDADHEDEGDSSFYEKTD
jgi:hypothetical protein